MRSILIRPCMAALQCALIAPMALAEAPKSAPLRAAAVLELETFDAKSGSVGKVYLDQNPELREELAGNDVFSALKDELPKVEVDGKIYYIVEGDVLKDEDELLLYADSRAAQIKLYEALKRGGGSFAAPTQPAGLVGMQRNGQLLRWAPGTVLSYTVLKDTFRNATEYQYVVNAMAEATLAWEGVCGVDFQYLPQHDDSTGSGVPSGALFIVRGINAQGEFIASAFFPDDVPARRRVLIDWSYFSTNFDRVGVLRHELGHVLGFRHEHIRSEAPAACPNESLFETTGITAYDPQSVMHYFCGGVGSQSLDFTSLDRQGAQVLYGPPLSSLILVEP